MPLIGHFIDFGQSNEQGANGGSPPVGIPNSAVRLNRWTGGGIDFVAFGDLDVMAGNLFGPELSAMLAMQALGYFDLVVCTHVTKGATSLGDWLPGQTLYDDTLTRKIGESRSWAQALSPGAAEMFFLSSCIGETDAANANGIGANAYETRYLTIRSALQTLLGQTLRPIITLTNANQASNASLSTVRAKQQALVTSAGALLVDMDDVALDPGDDLHYLATGEITHGERRAVKLQELIFMSITHGTATRTAVADTVVDRVDAGAAAGKIVIRAAGATLATVTLADPAFGNAVNGVATLNGTPLDDAATGAGTADNFLCQDSDGNTIFAGTVTATGGGGDLTLDTVTITTSPASTVTITGGSYTAPV